MSKPKTKGVIQKGADSGKDSIQRNMKDAAANQAGNTPEEYGGDKLDEGAQYLGYKAVDTAKDAGRKIKDKVTEKIRNKISEDRPKEKTDGEQKASRSETPGRERGAERIDDRKARVKEKPEATKESVKTKDNYIRSHNEPTITEQKKDPPKSRTEPAQKPKPSGEKTTQPKSAQTKSTQMRSAQPKPAQSHGIKTVRSAPQHTGNVAKSVGNAGKGTIKTATKGTVKTVGRGTVKTAQAGVKTTKAGVKTAQTTVKTTAKATKTAAQVAQKAAQAAAKAAQAAAKAAAKAAQLAAKAVATAVKAIIAAIKGIIAAIAAGGWVAVVIILAIAIVALIVCACCGVFASNETEDGSRPMTEAIQSIDGEFRAAIDAKIAELSAGDYDSIEVKYTGDMDGDSEFAINWNDTIAIYAVSVTMDPTAPTDVVQVTPEKVDKLRTIFSEMNTVNYSTEVIETEETIENEDDEEETVTRRNLIISVDVQSIDCYQAAEKYGFTEDQMEALEAMMEPQMLPLYAELVGVDVYGGADLTKIISGLPAGTMGSDVLNIAFNKVGAPYVLGAKGPNRFDCSGLVYWAINQIDSGLGRNLYTSAGYQYKYCKENGYLVGESEALPGDLIFWQKPNCSCGAKYNEIHHVGFYLGDGMILDASSSNGRVIIRKVFDGSSYKVYAYARPYSY